MSSLIDVLFFEAAVFILAVTGCFIYGVRLGLKDAKREQIANEIAELSDRRLNDPYYCFYIREFPKELVYDEKERRKDEGERRSKGEPTGDTNESALELYMQGMMNANETRDTIRRQMAATQSQVNQAMVGVVQFSSGAGNVNVIGSNNVVSTGSDGVRVPETEPFGTEERK